MLYYCIISEFCYFFMRMSINIMIFYTIIRMRFFLMMKEGGRKGVARCRRGKEPS